MDKKKKIIPTIVLNDEDTTETVIGMVNYALRVQDYLLRHCRKMILIQIMILLFTN